MMDLCKSLREELALEEERMLTDVQQEHLEKCTGCQRFLASLHAIDRGLESLPEHDVSDFQVRSVLRRIRAPRISGFRIFVPAAAAAFLAVFVLLWMPLYRGQKSFDREPEVADLRISNRQRELASIEESRQEEPGDKLGDLDALSSVSRRPSSAPPPPPAEGFADGSGRANGGLAGALGGERGQSLDNKDDAAQGKKGEGRFVENEGEEKNLPAAVGLATETPEIAASERTLSSGAYYMRAPSRPRKRVDRRAAYPEKAKASRVEGTVVLELTVDQEGDVTAVKVLRSVPGLDEAAVETAKEWKYEPSDSESSRTFREPVTFELEKTPEPKDERSLENLSFQEARGYWRNTYVPGDPMIRLLEARLAKAGAELFGGHAPRLHRASHRVPLPYDAPVNRSLSLYVHADTAGATEPRRVLVQVGLRAASHYGRRRPPMNVGVVLDLSTAPSDEDARSMRALLEALERSRELGDRFRLVVAGRGAAERLGPESFRRGPLSVALDDLLAKEEDSGIPLQQAVALAMERVHAGDDPTMPLGTSLLVLVTSRSLSEDVEPIAALAHRSALGGVPLSVIGTGTSIDAEELSRLALAGQGRRHFVERPVKADAVIDRELSATSRVVARAVRLRIKLAEGVQLVDVLGSEPLSARVAQQTREAEEAIDLRLARNLGIEADRGEDEDGIQIVIPSFYADDAHTFLLDVVVPGPGAVAEVTARYKDLGELENTVARASLSLANSGKAPGPLETSVVEDYFSFKVSRALANAAGALETGSGPRR